MADTKEETVPAHTHAAQRSGLEPLWRSSDKAATAKAVKRANNMQQQTRGKEQNRNYAAIIFSTVRVLLFPLLTRELQPFFSFPLRPPLPMNYIKAYTFN